MKDIIEIFRSKPTRIVMIIFGVAIFANTINYALQVYYYSNYAQLSASQIATVTMIFGVASIAGAWITDKLMVKLSKKVAWIIAVGLEGIVMVVMIRIHHPSGQRSWHICACCTDVTGKCSSIPGALGYDT